MFAMNGTKNIKLFTVVSNFAAFALMHYVCRLGLNLEPIRFDDKLFVRLPILLLKNEKPSERKMAKSVPKQSNL